LRAHQRTVGSLKLKGCMIGGCGCWMGFGTTPISVTMPLSAPRPIVRVDSRSHGVSGGGICQKLPL
jgi:hypothetical protein